MFDPLVCGRFTSGGKQGGKLTVPAQAAIAVTFLLRPNNMNFPSQALHRPFLNWMKMLCQCIDVNDEVVWS
jgi:hypothetical protein